MWIKNDLLKIFDIVLTTDFLKDVIDYLHMEFNINLVLPNFELSQFFTVNQCCHYDLTNKTYSLYEPLPKTSDFISDTQIRTINPFYIATIKLLHDSLVHEHPLFEKIILDFNNWGSGLFVNYLRWNPDSLRLFLAQKKERIIYLPYSDYFFAPFVRLEKTQVWSFEPINIYILDKTMFRYNTLLCYAFDPNRIH